MLHIDGCVAYMCRCIHHGLKTDTRIKQEGRKVVTQGDQMTHNARTGAADSAEMTASLPTAAPMSRPLVDRRLSTLMTSVSIRPQPHVPPPLQRLPVVSATHNAALWLVGAHGGAGETTFSQFDSQWSEAGHCWPEKDSGAPTTCVLLARTHAHGLLAARSALTQWASSQAGRSSKVLGLVLIADSPGRQPKPLRDLSKVVSGGAPAVWHVPWVESWRLGDSITETAPRSVFRLVDTLRSLSASAQAGAKHPTRKQECGQ